MWRDAGATGDEQDVAGVHHLRASAGDLLHQPSRGRGDTAEQPQEVQRHPLGRQDGGDVARVYSLGDWAAPYGIVLVADRLSTLMLGLTGVLGPYPDVAVHRTAEAAPGFDARFSALTRTYVYRVTTHPAGAAPTPSAAPTELLW